MQKEGQALQRAKSATRRESEGVKIASAILTPSIMTDLMSAITGGHLRTYALRRAHQPNLQTIERLLMDGADVNVNCECYNKNTPLITACLAGPLPLVRLLLKHGADPNVGHSGEYRTPLALCCATLRSDANKCASKFIYQHGLELCRVLIDHGAAVDGDDKDRRDWGPLWVASEKGNLDAMRLLLDRGAEVDRSPNGSRVTALTRTCQYSSSSRVAVAMLLLSRGADIHNALSTWSPAKYALKQREKHPDLFALFDPAPPPPRVRLRTHWRLRVAFQVVGRRASNPRSTRHELGLYRVSDIAAFLLPAE